ncbi:MAG: sulfatase [Myxococcales bacterium]|nr:MAG: sulfatase [Myxococcales bacterium]
MKKELFFNLFQWRRIATIVFVMALGIAYGCNKGSKLAEGSASALGELGDTPRFSDLRKQNDLLGHAHLADIHYRDGLIIDFGTPNRPKYTGGNWRSGWGRDLSQNQTTYTNLISTTARSFFQVDHVGPLSLKLRVKAIGSRNLTLYINGHALSTLQLKEANAFSEYTIDVDAAYVQPGENSLLWRLGGTKNVGGEEVSIAVDYLAIFPKSETTPQKVPSFTSFFEKIERKKERRDALVLDGPSQFTWYVTVPEQGKLGFALSALSESKKPQMSVTIKADGLNSKTLFSGETKDYWTEHLISLDEYVGQTVRIDMKNKGAGQIAVASPAVFVSQKDALPEIKPAKNVVLLIIDTLRADKLKPYNKNSRVQTPVLDTVSDQGAVFTQAHSPENWTKPSVASILTSLYPESHRTKQMESKLSESALLISEIYRKAGYRTGSFIANGHVSDRFGFKQGWDYYTNYIREKKISDAEHVFTEASKWIEKNKDNQFFAFIQTIDPHVPYDPPGEFLQLYDKQDYSGPISPRNTSQNQVDASRGKIELSSRDKARLAALYDAEISYHDHHLGEFIEKLKAWGVYDDTVFVITADHGEEFGDHGKYGHGHSVYEELLHVPLSFRFPGVVPKKIAVPHTVSTLDIGPTLLELSGIKEPPTMEGHSLWPYMNQLEPARPSVAFSDFLDNRRVITAGRWKLIQRGGRGDASLFDLKTDPAEQHELSSKQRPIAWRYCRTLLGQFLGARDRQAWISAKQGGSKELKQESTQIDDETRKQLCALGYGNCDDE